MELTRLNLVNFKNIESASLDFGQGINALVGLNGAGKTNVIDAIYCLSMCKSSLGQTDRGSIRHGSEGFVVDGKYSDQHGKMHSTLLSFTAKTGKKIIKYDDKEYDRIADHVGKIPVVIVSPTDSFLVNDAADERRRYLNSFISQLDAEYLATVMRYNAVLGERNRLLKQPMGRPMQEILDVLDLQLTSHGNQIHAKREQYIQMLTPSLEKYYALLSHDSEKVTLKYSSELNDTPFEQLLQNARQKDFVNQFTTSGIHRDDMLMRIGDRPLKRYGSQGQQKSFLVALKLAQYEVVESVRNEKPILLLDDLLDKLDSQRVSQLIEIIRGNRFGQSFISDCNATHLKQILDASGEYTIFEVSDGTITKQ